MKWKLLLLDGSYYPNVVKKLKKQHKFELFEHSMSDKVDYNRYDITLLPINTAYKVDVNRLGKFIVVMHTDDAEAALNMYRIGAADVITPPAYNSRLLGDL